MAQPSVGQLRQSIVLCLRDERREGRRFASGSPDIEQRAEMSTARGFAYPQLGTCERALMGSLVPPRESKRRLEERAAAGGDAAMDENARQDRTASGEQMNQTENREQMAATQSELGVLFAVALALLGVRLCVNRDRCF